VFAGNPDLSTVVLADTGRADEVPLRLLERQDPESARAHSLAWRVTAAETAPSRLPVAATTPVRSLARLLSPLLLTQWRQLAGDSPPERPGDPFDLALAQRQPQTAAGRAERRGRHALAPVLPGLPRDGIRRWVGSGTWTPVETIPLCRHRRIGGEDRVFTNSRIPPPGHEIEFDLGTIQYFPKPGTHPLVVDERGVPRLAEPEEVGRGVGTSLIDPDATDPPGGGVRVIGHLEQVPFPMFLALEAGVDPTTGQTVLVSSTDDQLGPRVVDRRTLGFIESYPIEPRHPPTSDYSLGLAGLVCGVDQGGRRHVYEVGAVPDGVLVGELGSVLTDDRPGLIPLRCGPGGVVTTGRDLVVPERPSLHVAARWTLAPLAWRGPWGRVARLRAVARRTLETLLAFLGLTRAGSGGRGERDLGFLLPDPGQGRVSLYSSFNPVNGDQLLTRTIHAAATMGYTPPVLLGYLRTTTPVTGVRRLRAVAVPGASRFGANRPQD
jgi:hypothetical protein